MEHVIIWLRFTDGSRMEEGSTYNPSSPFFFVGMAVKQLLFHKETRDQQRKMK